MSYVLIVIMLDPDDNGASVHSIRFHRKVAAEQALDWLHTQPEVKEALLITDPEITQ